MLIHGAFIVFHRPNYFAISHYNIKQSLWFISLFHELCDVFLSSVLTIGMPNSCAGFNDW